MLVLHLCHKLHNAYIKVHCYFLPYFTHAKAPKLFSNTEFVKFESDIRNASIIDGWMHTQFTQHYTFPIIFCLFVKITPVFISS